MRLFEHPDFEQAILRAAEHFRERNLRPAIIEKDYYVTEALRVLANTSGSKIIFKRGTSLAKGWNLIQRFSEDIDIFLDPTAFQPALGKNAIDRELKKLRDSVGQHPALLFVENESQTSVDSGEMTVFPIPNDSADQARLPTACSLRRAQRAGGNHPLLWNCAHTWANIWKRRNYLWVRKTKGGSPFACSIFGGHLLRRCSLSIARSSCSNETSNLLAATHGTTTTCFNCQNTAKSASCCVQPNTARLRLITIRSVERISLKATPSRKA